MVIAPYRAYRLCCPPLEPFIKGWWDRSLQILVPTSGATQRIVTAPYKAYIFWCPPLEPLIKGWRQLPTESTYSDAHLWSHSSKDGDSSLQSINILVPTSGVTHQRMVTAHYRAYRFWCSPQPLIKGWFREILNRLMSWSSDINLKKILILLEVNIQDFCGCFCMFLRKYIFWEISQPRDS